MQHAKSLGDLPQTMFRQPDGATYAQWATCLWLPLSAKRWERIEAFLQQNAVRSRKIAKTFETTPCAVGWRQGEPRPSRDREPPDKAAEAGGRA